MLKEKKILSVQYLRGLASLAVVLCHYGSDMSTYPRLSTILNFGQTGVFVFFLISGFIIVYSLEKLNYKPHYFFRFLLKRSIRIDPSYYVVIILTLVLFKVLSFIPSFRGEQISFIPGQFVAHIFYIVPFTKYPFYNHVFWTLSIEFQFYLLIGTLYFLSESALYKSIFLILFGLTCLIPFANSYYLIFNYAPIFAFGISLVNFAKKRNWLTISVASFLIILVLYKFGVLIFILIAISSAIIFLLKMNIKPLTFLGDISYSLYLIHSIVLIVFLGLIKRINLNSNSDQILWLFIEVVVAILAAYLFFYLIERPSLRLSKRIFYKKESIN